MFLEGQQPGNVLCHVFATVDTYPSELHVVRAWFLYLDEIKPVVDDISHRAMTVGRDGAELPWVGNDGAFFQIPSLQHALDVGFESGGERFLDLILIT